MNRLWYYIYDVYTAIGKWLGRKYGTDSVIRYKINHRINLNMAENLTILRDVDRVIYGEMRLSEYINKWGTIHVDEKFQDLFVKDRPETPNYSIKFRDHYKPSDELS